MASSSMPPDSLPAPATSSEGAPLLVASDSPSFPHEEDDSTIPPSNRVRTSLGFRILAALTSFPNLTKASIVLTAIYCVLLIAVFILLAICHQSLGWPLDRDMFSLLGLQVFALPFSIVAFRRMNAAAKAERRESERDTGPDAAAAAAVPPTLPSGCPEKAVGLILNGAVNGFVAFNMAQGGMNNIDSIGQGYRIGGRMWCYGRGWSGPGNCEVWNWVLLVLVAMALVVVLFNAAVHLVLFVLRAVLLFRLWTWNWKDWRFNVPPGEFTIAFTVKLVRQEDLERSRVTERERVVTEGGAAV